MTLNDVVCTNASCINLLILTVQLPQLPRMQ